MFAKKALAASVSAAPKVYVEDVFSTYLYTGTGSAQTITNGIDLAANGGLVWIKQRSVANNHFLAHEATVRLRSDTTNGNATTSDGVTSFNSSGFSIGANGNLNGASDGSNASWTFRKAEKFFDVVTYSGNGSLPNQLISHNLGSVPGCIIIKATNASRNWIVWHRGNGTTNYGVMSLNLTAASNGSVSSGDLPTSTQFKPGAFFDPDYNSANETGITYVAYLFAHDAGGFGDAGDQNVISCGTWTGSNQTITLGWEPQFVLWKRTDSTGNWHIHDNMRGMPVTRSDASLYPNLTDAESTEYLIDPTATGFIHNSGASGTYIYVAIRRGPMKTPESGTSVFSPNALSVTSGATITTNFPVDMSIGRFRSLAGEWSLLTDRLRGVPITDTSTGNRGLNTTSTDAEGNYSPYSYGWDSNTRILAGSYGNGYTQVYWNFRRAPGFFDVVCYTGTGVTRTVSHNLGVAPELMIVKSRSSGVYDWRVYSSTLGNTKYMALNAAGGEATSSTSWNNTSPTSSVFTVGSSAVVNDSGGTYVAYLFASVTGVSKVGSYTGNGSSQTINCGFTAGARFVLIKRTDSTGDWVVFDSARGIVSGNDPALELNTTDAEVTTIDAVDTDNSGFVVNQDSTLNLNVNSATYIYLAIA